MTDHKHSSAFSRFQRPAVMVVMMFMTAGLGATGAFLLHPGVPGRSEEKHAEQKHAPTDEDQHKASDARLAQSADNDHHKDHDEDSARSSESSDHNVDQEIHEHEDSSTVPSNAGSGARARPADPFSEDALGFGLPSAEESQHESSHMAQHESPTGHLSGHISGNDSDTHGHSAEHEADHPTSQAASHGDQSHSSDHDALVTHQDPHGHSESSGNAHATSDTSAPANEDHGLPLLSDSHAERTAESQKQRTSDPARRTRQEQVTQQAVNYMSMADEDLAGGNYVDAMRAYQALRQKSEGPPAAALLFRLALCAEAAGRHAAALEAYRRISGTQTDPAWVGVARYGEARCLAAMRKHEGLQTDLLRRVLLDETEFLPTVRAEVMHLIGRDLWREQSVTSIPNLLDDKTLIVPEWSPDPVRLLDELPLLVHETPTKPGKIAFQVLSFETQTPDGIVVRLNCGVTRMESLLKKLVEGCRLGCEISPQAIEVLRGRTQQIHVAERSLAQLLDGMTIPCGLAWQLNETEVSIVHPDQLTPQEVRKFRLAAAERILRIAVMEGPNSPQIGHSRLALSTLLFEDQRAAEAVQYLQVQTESAPRSVVATEAAFNLGKCLMILNQRDEARQAFLRSVDASGGLIDVRIASYIFHSRILLEDNQTKVAIPNMMRGLAISDGSVMEPFAALQLASLYLMQNNPQGANTVLMERREALAEGPGKAGGAFVSALARFRAAVLADRREREGAAVVSALTEFDPADYCGGHWAVLVAGACEELGLSQQSTESYVLALKKLPPSDLRNKTVLRLVSRYEADHQLEEARLLLATLTSTEADQLSLQAKLRTAELALEQNHPEEAILTCRQLITDSEEPQIERAALRVMGRAYERQKNHQAAIYCFAGLLPDVNVDAVTPDSEHHTDHGGHAP